MPTRVGTLPKTMPSPETGEILTRGVRPFEVTYKGETTTVKLPGYYPAEDGEGVHVGDDMAVVDQALRELKELVDGIPTPKTIRAIRNQAGLSQRAAGALFRVGPSAFDKYERGIIEPSGPTITLLKLLWQDPKLAKKLEATRVFSKRMHLEYAPPKKKAAEKSVRAFKMAHRARATSRSSKSA